jgi:hypothetical protein
LLAPWRMAICFVDVSTLRKEQEENAGFPFHFDYVLEEGLGRAEAPLVRMVERFDHRVLGRQLVILQRPLSHNAAQGLRQRPEN